MQREAFQRRAQRALGLRLPATIAADATVAPARAFTKGRASCHRRGGEAGQQVVSGGTFGIRRGVFVDPLPGFAQRPQHAGVEALHEQLAWTRTFRADPEPRSSRLLHYHRRWIARRSGPPRLIEAPKAGLKQIQQRLLHGLLDHVPAHPAAHGFVRGRGITTLAAPHRGTACVLRLDLRDFFASITRRRVRAVFSALGYPVDTAQHLAALSTVATPLPLLRELLHAGAAGAALHERLRQPHLPQGAPSSPALANLVAFRLDARLAGLARRFGASYTRYADDLLFSGGAEFARGSARCAEWVAKIVTQEGFALAAAKTRRMRQGTRQHAAGMVLNVHAAVSRAERDQLEAQLHNCVQRGPSTQNRAGIADLRGHLRGRIAHVRHCHAPHTNHLQALFDRIDWSRGTTSASQHRR